VTAANYLVCSACCYRWKCT